MLFKDLLHFFTAEAIVGTMNDSDTMNDCCCYALLLTVNVLRSAEPVNLGD